MSAPYSSGTINSYLSTICPNTFNTTSDLTTAYYERMLFQRAMSVFKFNIPTDWDYGYFTGVLSVMGYLPIVDTSRFDGVTDYGIIPQYGQAYGYGIFYQPKKVNCISPLVSITGAEIGKDLELVRLTPDWCGIWDIIHTYAEQLALCNKAVSMSLTNSTVSWVIAAKDKARATTIKEIFNKVQSGETTVIYDAKALPKSAEDTDLEPWHTFTRDVKASYVSDLALADYNTILCAFDEEVGIANLRGAAATKKERVTTAEVNVNNVATSARLRTWCDTLDQSIKRVNDFYEQDLISYELRREEMLENAKTDNDPSGVGEI